MRCSVVIMMALLAGCAEREGVDTAAGAATSSGAVRAEMAGAQAAPSGPSAAVGAVEPVAGMPGDACTLDGYWSFFEAFVRVPALRPAHSDDAGRAALASFDIAQQDSRWVRAGDPTVALEITERREDTRFEVDATPVELDADDEIVRTLGPVRRYRFDFSNGCWRFAGTR